MDQRQKGSGNRSITKRKRKWVNYKTGGSGNGKVEMGQRKNGRAEMSQ